MSKWPRNTFFNVFACRFLIIGYTGCWGLTRIAHRGAQLLKAFLLAKDLASPLPPGLYIAESGDRPPSTGAFLFKKERTVEGTDKIFG
jgi:hypothetical protein